MLETQNLERIRKQFQKYISISANSLNNFETLEAKTALFPLKRAYNFKLIVKKSCLGFFLLLFP